MITTIADEVHWIHECHDHGNGHIHVSAFVIEEDGKNILIDTGDLHYRDEIEGQIEEVTSGSGVDSMFISKSHLPHSANVSNFISTWPDADVIFPGGIPEVHGFPEVVMWPHRGTEELYGRTFSTTQGPLLDITHTTWIYDHASEIFFTIDGFCYYHKPGQCHGMSSEYKQPFTRAHIQSFYEDILLWLQYVDPDKLMSILREIQNEQSLEYIAPTHGNPIHADDIPDYMNYLDQSVRSISSN
jgi:flavorubredoxin